MSRALSSMGPISPPFPRWGTLLGNLRQVNFWPRRGILFPRLFYFEVPRECLFRYNWPSLIARTINYDPSDSEIKAVPFVSIFVAPKLLQ